MAKVDAQVRLDASVLAGVDAAARRLGRSRDELIEDSVRRDLAGQLLGGVFSRVSPADGEALSEEDAAALVYDELDNAQVERGQASR